MDLAYFGHHKCASTSTEALCFDLCNKLGYFPVYKKTAFNPNLSEYLKKGKNFIISINSSYENIDRNHNFKGFHIIRDPRDICVSAYFSHLHSHKLEGFDGLAGHRKKLKKLDFNEGLLLDIEYTSFWLNHIKDWNYQDDRILEIKLEEIIASPHKTWLQIFSWLVVIDFRKQNDNRSHGKEAILFKLNHYFRIVGWPNVFLKKGLNEKTLLEISDKYSFKALSKGREVGQENIKSHYRKGQAGDWRNYFNEEHKTCFKDRYGDLLIQLGYEKDSNW